MRLVPAECFQLFHATVYAPPLLTALKVIFCSSHKVPENPIDELVQSADNLQRQTGMHRDMVLIRCVQEWPLEMLTLKSMVIISFYKDLIPQHPFVKPLAT